MVNFRNHFEILIFIQVNFGYKNSVFFLICFREKRKVYSMPCQSITDFYSELIQNTLKNYRQGCVNPIQPPVSDFFALFYNDWQTFIETKLSLTDQRFLHRLEKIRTKGLNAARQGDLIKAEQHFKMARTRLQLDKLSAQTSLLVKSSLERSEAYLDYRLGDFDKARNRTFEILETYVFLEREYGYEILFLRRIQLLCNLVQLEAGCMRYEYAIKLASQLLSYLEGRLEVLPFPGNWGREPVMRQSLELMAATFALVTCEVAKILVGKNHQLTKELFTMISFNLQLQTNNNCYCHPRSYSWLLVKQAFVNQDIPKFLELTANFLVEGRADTPLLWYAAIIDLVILCDEIELTEFQLMKQEILKDSVNWEDCPQKFMQVIEEIQNSKRQANKIQNIKPLPDE